MTDGPYFPLVVNRRHAPDDRRHGDRRQDGTHPALDLPLPQRLSADAYKAARVIDRDVDNYAATYQFELTVLRDCPPAEEKKQARRVACALQALEAIKLYRDAIDTEAA